MREKIGAVVAAVLVALGFLQPVYLRTEEERTD